MAAILVTMVQTPTVALEASEGCQDTSARWAARLKAEGFDVASSASAPTRGFCLSAKMGGYILEGPVAPEALSKLLMKKPRGVLGLKQADDTPVVALLSDGGQLPFQTILDKEKKH
jgi:hypothetical protein